MPCCGAEPAGAPAILTQRAARGESGRLWRRSSRGCRRRLMSGKLSLPSGKVFSQQAERRGQEPLDGAVGHGTTGRAPPPSEAAVETVSGGRGGVRPTLRAAAARGVAGGAVERLRLDATARLAGHAVVEIGTHVEILGSQRRVRVDAVEYDGYPDAERLLSSEEETWLGR